MSNQPLTGVTALGLRACARELGITHGRLAALVRERRVPRNADGSFDVEAVRAAFEASKDPAHRSKISPPFLASSPRPEPEAEKEPEAEVAAEAKLPPMSDTASSGFNEVRTKHETVKLRLAEIELAQRHGRLIADRKSVV